MAGQSSGGSDSLSVNGLYLQFYLDQVKESVELLKTKDAELYFLYTHYLKALITEKEYLIAIDKAQADVRKEVESMKDFDGNVLNTNMKQYLEAFCVVNACMKFLTYSLNIIKRDVEINADQTDEGMPGTIQVSELMEESDIATPG